jgi:uncharacterized protein (TIGR00369 family)
MRGMAETRPDALANGLPPVLRTLGCEVVERGEDRAVMRFPVKPEFTNPRGQVQGGILGSMMDGCMAVAANGLATVTLQFSLLRPVSEGPLTVSAQVVRRGRQILYCEAEIVDAEGRLVARGNQNAVPVPPPEA